MAQEPEAVVSPVRLRYALRVVVRVVALGLFFYSGQRLIAWMESLVYMDTVAGAFGFMFSSQSILWLVLLWAPYPALGVLLLVLERRLVLWLVPPLPRHRCPGCDYDTRYATGGRCPECGLQLEKQ